MWTYTGSFRGSLKSSTCVLHDINTLLIDNLIGNMEQHKVMACPKDIYLKILEGWNCYCVCIQGWTAWVIEVLRTKFHSSGGSTQAGVPWKGGLSLPLLQLGPHLSGWRSTRSGDFDHGSIKTFDMPQRLPA